MPRVQPIQKRASYRDGIAWIAVNDELSEQDTIEIAGLLSVCLLADLFGVEPERVAADVLAYRKRRETKA